MKKIKLAGKYSKIECIVDARWEEMFKDGGVKMFYHRNYAAFCTKVKGKQKWEFVHSIVSNFKGNNILCVDHINMNKLDNRSDNLRIVTIKENNTNSTKASAKSKTGVRNVYFYQGLFVVKFFSLGKNIRYKTFKTLEEAILDAAKFREGLIKSIQS